MDSTTNLARLESRSYAKLVRKLESANRFPVLKNRFVSQQSTTGTQKRQATKAVRAVVKPAKLDKVSLWASTRDAAFLETSREAEQHMSHVWLLGVELMDSSLPLPRLPRLKSPSAAAL